MLKLTNHLAFPAVSCLFLPHSHVCIEFSDFFVDLQKFRICFGYYSLIAFEHTIYTSCAQFVSCLLVFSIVFLLEEKPKL